MNKLADIDVDESSFTWRDLQDLDVWTKFDPVFVGLTVVGATAYNGRYRLVGKQGFLQLSFAAATSIESTSGTTYLTLPFPAIGVAGQVQLVNLTSKAEVTGARIIVSERRLYLPTIAATSNSFALAAWTEA